jgi:hypothetical protein
MGYTLRDAKREFRRELEENGGIFDEERGY